MDEAVEWTANRHGIFYVGEHMIVDRIENVKLYSKLSKNLATALKILQSKKLRKQAVGRYEVKGTKLYYMVQNYVTKPTDGGEFEAHKKYIDVQCVLDGEESIPYANISDLKVSKRYKPKADVAFYRLSKDYTSVNLSKGMFCVLFPEDAHLPCRILKKKSNVHKIVIKVPVK
jgi:biofilm protein TabA